MEQGHSQTVFLRAKHIYTFLIVMCENLESIW